MINRNTPPRLSPLTVPSLLPYEQLTLPNGIPVIYINDPSQEVFKIDITFEAGILYQQRPLVASTAINMLNEGTHRHKAEKIADLFDYYGAYLDYYCGLNKSEISLISLSKYAGETICMLTEMLTDSIFPEKEFEIYLANKRQEFIVDNEKTASLARKEFASVLFGKDHPYANPIAEEDFTSLTIDMVREFYLRHINARNCRIMICGKVDTAILEAVTRQFGSLHAPTGEITAPSYTFQPGAPGNYFVRKENAVQSSVRIGKTGVRLPENDYAGFILLNTLLGGYFGSRLMSNIREEKGYTYGINSFNVSMPLSSYWCIAADVNREYTSATIDETLKEIRRLQTEPVPEEELALVKNFLHGDLLRELDGVFAQSDALKHKLNYGLDNSIYTDLINKIKQCTAEELMSLAQKYWNIADLYIVTAGDGVK